MRVNIDALLACAQAVREAAKPENFSMALYGWTRWFAVDADRGDMEINECGTPACVIGHYASRQDLQNVLILRGNRLIWKQSDVAVSYADPAVLDYFGLDDLQADELFGSEGCGEAESPSDAADYIEDWVATYQRELANGTLTEISHQTDADKAIEAGIKPTGEM